MIIGLAMLLRITLHGGSGKRVKHVDYRGTPLSKYAKIFYPSMTRQGTAHARPT
jgi:hypothetical protein